MGTYACPDACVTTDLTPLPAGGCETTYRKNTTSRLAMAMCSFEEPSDYTETNTPPLFADNTIVMTNLLRNVAWADPTTDTILIHDCDAPAEFVTGRVLTCEDVIKIETTGTGADKWADYAFYKDKQAHAAVLRYAWIDCDGNFTWARDANGNLATAKLMITLKDQKVTSGNVNFSIEVKELKLTFACDPRQLTAPDFNLRDFGIDF